MYCNQCGSQMKDTANFCKKCGSPMDPTNGEISERKRQMVKFFYTQKQKLAICTVAALLLCGLGAYALFWLRDNGQKPETPPISTKKVSAVDLKDAYMIEEDKLILDPLYVTYDDGTKHQLLDYDVYIDTLKCPVKENALEAANLYDGKHLFRLEWISDAKKYKYEKTINTEHKKDTWEKYVDLVGMTGKQIAAAHGSLGTPQFGSLGTENWGIATVAVPSLNLRASFPAGLLSSPDDYSGSDASCIEMSGTLNTFFYNIEPEMTREDLARILKLTLTDMDGGCFATLKNGKLLYIESSQGGIYTPDAPVRVTVSDDQKAGFFDRLF